MANLIVSGIDVNRRQYDAWKDTMQSVRDQYGKLGQVDYLGETLKNPNQLTDQELEWLALYFSGFTGKTDQDVSRMTNAYNKFTAAQQWYSQYNVAQAETEYNSPEQSYPREVAGQIAAGLNPDLVGVESGSGGTAAGASAGSGSSSAPYASPVPGDWQRRQGLYSNVLDTINTAVNVVNAVTGFGSALSSMHTQALARQNDFLKNTFPSMVKYLPDEYFQLTSDVSDAAGSADVIQASISSEKISSIMSAAGFGKQDIKRFNQALAHNPITKEDYNNWANNATEFEQRRQAYATQVASKYRENFMSGNELFDRLAALSNDLSYAEILAKLNRQKYDAEFYGNLNPEIMASGEEATAEGSVIKKDILSTDRDRVAAEYGRLKAEVDAYLPLLKSAVEHMNSDSMELQIFGRLEYEQLMGRNGNLYQLLSGAASGLLYENGNNGYSGNAIELLGDKTISTALEYWQKLGFPDLIKLLSDPFASRADKGQAIIDYFENPSQIDGLFPGVQQQPIDMNPGA